MYILRLSQYGKSCICAFLVFSVDRSNKIYGWWMVACNDHLWSEQSRRGLQHVIVDETTVRVQPVRLQIRTVRVVYWNSYLIPPMNFPWGILLRQFKICFQPCNYTNYIVLYILILNLVHSKQGWIEYVVFFVPGIWSDIKLSISPGLTFERISGRILGWNSGIWVSWKSVSYLLDIR